MVPLKKKQEKPQRKYDAKKVLGAILFLSLLMSAVYTVVRLILAPSASEAGEFDMQRADYTLMLLQCLLGIVVMLLPSILERRLSIPIPNFIFIMYYIFLYCAVFLGEVFSFYYHVKHWDTILHAFSGAMLGALGFILVDLLNNIDKVGVHLSPFFVALFAFCFALAMGAMWEIYEFTVDSLMHLNMQKYLTEAGEVLVGREVLMDTMEDIITDAIAAFFVSALGYLSLKQARKEGGDPKLAETTALAEEEKERETV